MVKLILAALAFLALHSAAVVLAKGAAMPASYVFLIAGPICATLACFWRSRHCSGIARGKWLLVAIGFAFWSAGMILSARVEIFLHAQQNFAFLGDFIYFSYGVPVLVALSVTTHDQNFRPILLLDAMQALLALVLAYFVLFNVLPFARSIAHPVPVPVLVHVYNIENVVLILAAIFPLLASPKGEEKAFYRILGGYCISYAIVVGVYNYATAYWHLNTGTLADVITDVPFLLLAVLAIGVEVGCSESPQFGANPVALFVNNASPILFTLAVLALGAYLTTKTLYLGLFVTCLALVTYCLRATILQSRYFSVQLALHEANGKLEELSLRDPLTGVANRRGFERALNLECERAERTGEPLSLLMLDIDYFKVLNDRNGHVHGDECLVGIATELENNLNRSSDTIARYGGEEFAVVLPKTDLEGAKRVAEKLRSAVLELFIPNETEMSDFVTISVGIAAYGCTPDGSINAFVDAADKALYAAKRNGRNRFEIAVSLGVNQPS
jgi:diguanylate cyclase (GGDEF)-like protein